MRYDESMNELFADTLTAGGKTNSLGRVNEVIELVLHDKSRLEELYICLFHEDAWVRMRAADALEKICRVHPEWFESYVDRFNKEVSPVTQASVRWHLAQMYGEIPLTKDQKDFAITWLKDILSSKDIDWIVASTAMDTLVQFTLDGSVPKPQTMLLLKVQQHHKSKAIGKRATKLLDQLQ